MSKIKFAYWLSFAASITPLDVIAPQRTGEEAAREDANYQNCYRETSSALEKIINQAQYFLLYGSVLSANSLLARQRYNG